MTTNEHQQELVDPDQERRLLERQVEVHLKRLGAWTRLPDERTDWELERLLSELAIAAKHLRQFRNDETLPF